MVFQRRDKLSWLGLAREAIWPRSGPRRAFTYWLYRVLRLRGGPSSVAAGLAGGVAASFTPFLGLHFFIGILVSWPWRGNVLAVAIGTLIGNPWTFPFIWWATLTAGRWLTGIEGPDFPETWPEQPGTGIPEWWEKLTFLFEHWRTFLIPMSVSGILCGVLAFPLAYFPVYKAVASYRARRSGQLQSGGAERTDG